MQRAPRNPGAPLKHSRATLGVLPKELEVGLRVYMLVLLMLEFPKDADAGVSEGCSPGYC